MLERLKTLLGETKQTDAALTFLLERVTALVLAECNREDIPKELETVILSVVVAHLNAIKSGDTGAVASDAPVSSITRGDTTISYAVGKEAATSTSDDLLKMVWRFEPFWHRFRKARGVR